MNVLRAMAAGCVLSLSLYSCGTTVENTNENFKYSVDEFADLQILRYKITGWDSLSLNQKAYIYHLGEAAKSGRDILFSQNFKYNLPIRKMLEKIIVEYKGNRESSDFKEFLVYAKRVFFSNGIHHHYAEDKFFPLCPREYFAGLMKECGMESITDELLPVIYDTDKYMQRKSTSKEGDLLLTSAVNFYSGGITKEEANAFYAKMEDPKDETPLSYGINSRLEKVNGKIAENVYRLGGLYGNSIKAIVSHLEKAKQYAGNEAQVKCIEKLVEYYTTGSLEAWDEYNVAWVQDTISQVDFVNGFIESYNDPLGRKATWESVVNFKDMEASKRTEIISANAQWFEDNSPIRPEFKKKSVKGVSAKVITVACLGGDCYPATPIGINLPNADWIRKDYGSKSVTIANITSAYNKAAEESPKNMTHEFYYSEEDMELLKKYRDLTNDLHTDLHECLGHGSGQLLPGVSPNALGEFSSTLEEARADLFALYYLADEKLVELGITPDMEAYKAEYLSQTVNGLFTQFTRVELGKTNTEAHMQDRKLIAQWCYEKGLKENNPGAGKDVIEMVRKGDKSYFIINDYGKLRTLYGNLLAEIQRIKSEGDYKAGKELVEKYAIDIDYNLHKEVLERYASLNLKPYKGFVNPDIVPVTDSRGNITDYKVVYCNDYLEQMLKYGREYSFE